MAGMCFGFFVFTANLQLDNGESMKTLVKHWRALLAMGYVGFDLPLARGTTDCAKEAENYKDLRKAFDEAGLRNVKLTTNVEANL